VGRYDNDHTCKAYLIDRRSCPIPSRARVNELIDRKQAISHSEFIPARAFVREGKVTLLSEAGVSIIRYGAMPALKNQRHELFAQAVASGKFAKDAYVEAGFHCTSRTAKSESSRLLSVPIVRARVNELIDRKQAIEEEAERKSFHCEVDERAKSKAWILNNLVELANRCMQTTPVMDRVTGGPLLVVGPGGKEYMAMAQYSPRDALRALELLGRERGMFIEGRIPKGENDDLKDMSREELEKIIYGKTLVEIEAERRAEAKALPVPKGGQA
jgi:hypothetical protein